METTGKTLKSFVSWLSRSESLPVLFAVYVVPRIAILVLEVEPKSDAAWYYNRAVALATGRGFSESGIPTAYWPPGWSLVVATIFQIFGVSLFAVQIFNIGCCLATGWLTIKLGEELFHSQFAGRMALLLLALYPNNIAYVPLVWTEVFYTMLLMLGCFLIVSNPRSWRLALAGLVFGFATLVKTQSLIIIPFIFGIDFLRGRADLKGLTYSLSKCGVVVALAFVVILPWSYRNYRTLGEWVLVSTNGGLTLLTGNNPSARGDHTPDDPLVQSIQRSVANQIEVDREARKRALHWIKENPNQFIALMPLKAFRLWIPDGESEWWYQSGFKSYDQFHFWFRMARYINQAYYLSLLMMFGWAGVLLFNRKGEISSASIDWWALPYVLAIYLTLIAIMFSGQSRYHYQIMPFVALCCGWLILHLCSGVEEERVIE